MDKSPDAFRTISEVAEWLGVQTHVLRFWESKFSQVKPVKRAGGRRYYRPADMSLLGGIKTLLHDDGMTIKGVQKLLREEGVAHVATFSQSLDKSAEPAPSAPATDEDLSGENVVRFQARADDLDGSAAEEADEPAPAEPDPEPDPEPAPDPAPDASPLPSFLTKPMGDAPAPEPPKPAIVDAPDPPPEDQIVIAPGALTRAARLTRIDDHSARDLAPLISRLAVLRDRLAGSGG